MILNPELQQYSIVLIGDFNPLMFTPEWFLKNHVISPEDVEVARDESIKNSIIITAQLTFFKTSQLSFKVEMNRMEIVSENGASSSVMDFVTKMFESIGGFVIKAYGFNYSAHYNVKDNATYQLIGDKLAPKCYWKTLLKEEVSGLDRKSGLTIIQMQKHKPDESGYYKVILQPSNFIKPGVFLSCNDHTIVDKNNNSADDVVTRIEKTYFDSIVFMEKVQIDLLTEVTKGNE